MTRQEPSREYSTRPVVSVDAAAATVHIRCSGIDFHGGGGAILMVGDDERPTTVRPGGQPVVAECHEDSPLGPLHVRSLSWPLPEGITLTWRVGVCERRSGFTLQAAVYNGTGVPFRLREFSLLDAATTRLDVEGDPAAWHLGDLTHNGGSLAEVLLSSNERTKRMWEGFNMPVPHELPQDEKSNDGRWRRHSNLVSLYTDNGRRGLYAGAVGEESNVGFDWHVAGACCKLDVIGNMDDVRVDAGETRRSETVLFLAEPYAEAAAGCFRWLAAALGARTHRGPAVGWCSWYHKGPGVTAEHVVAVSRAVAARRDRLPMEVIQIDDGFERQAGDWECNDTFPEGWQPVVASIRQAGATPGIWLAPLAAHEKVAGPNYTCEKEGRLLDVHPDWFQRDATGKLHGSADNWGPTAYWLDPTHPGVTASIRRIIRRAMQEGFRYFKIDFNTVGGRLHDPKKTHLQALRDLYRLYREEIGEDAYLLSCSGLTRATVGLADSSRIGPDSCATWNAPHPCCIRDCIPAVASSAYANGLLYANDPDVSYMRPTWQLTASELRIGTVSSACSAARCSFPTRSPIRPTRPKRPCACSRF